MKAEDLDPAAPATKRFVGVARAEGVRRVVDTGQPRAAAAERRRVAARPHGCAATAARVLFVAALASISGVGKCVASSTSTNTGLRRRVSHRVRRRDECERWQHTSAPGRVGSGAAQFQPNRAVGHRDDVRNS